MNREAQARAALEKLSQPGRQQSIRMRLDARDRTPVFISGRFRAGRAATAEAAAAGVLAALAPVYGLGTPGRHLVLEETLVDDLGYSHLRYQQVYRDVPVEGGEVRVHIDSAGWVTSINGHLAPGVRVPVQAKVSADQAIVVARDGLEKELSDPTRPPLPDSAFDLTSVGTPELRILAGRSSIDGQGQNLAWKVRLGRWVAFVDARTARLVVRTLTGDAVSVDTYTANGGSALPGTLVASNDPEQRSAGIDDEESAAQEYAVEYASYLEEAFGRGSIDDLGLRLIQTVQYEDMSNAYWDDTQAVFGPGWATRDIVGHEFTHGLTQYTADLVYSNEAGGLNESFSDVFAVMIDRDDWLQGEEADGFSEDNPVRSMSDPHKGDRFHPEQSYNAQTNSGQPAHYSELVTSSDPICSSTSDAYNGCVHFNSGIHNHCAYLMAEGGSEGGVIVLGTGRSDTEQVFYRNLATRLTSYSDMLDARDNALEACFELYGEDSTPCIAAQNAFAAVGLGEGYYHTLRVALDGSGDYTSIQAAIDAAEEGDHIEIAAGTYVEAIDLGGKPLVLAGEDAAATVLQGTGGVPVVRLAATDRAGTSISDLTVTGGSGAEGGGIACVGATAELEDLVLTGNGADSGGGLGARDCALTLRQVIVDGNDAVGPGGGIWLEGGSLEAEDLEVRENRAGAAGGGIYANGGLTLDGVQVEANQAGGEGGGLASVGTLEATDVTVTGNGALAEGGGVWLSGSAGLEQVTVEGNTASSSGGGVWLAGSVSFISGTVEGNVAGAQGGGLAASEGASGTLSAVLIMNNEAVGGGGVAFAGTTGLEAHNLIVSSNAAALGGGVLAGGTAAVTLTNLAIVDNSADGGSGVYADESASILLDSSIVAFNRVGAGVQQAATASLTVAFSDVYGNPSSGSDNLEADPLFASFSANQDGADDDLHLQAGSPCIDTGNPDSAHNDLDGTRNDMGAYGGPHRSDWPGEYEPCFAGLHPISLGDSVSGTLDAADPTDGPRGNAYHYEDAYFYVEAGTALRLYLDASFDAYLYLYSPTCSRVAYNDDGGDGTDSLVTYTATESGYFTAVATSYYSGATGSFTLTTE